MPNWTIVCRGQVVRHFPFTDTGYADAAANAAPYRYELWQSFDGVPRYLMWRPRY